LRHRWKKFERRKRSLKIPLKSLVVAQLANTLVKLSRVVISEMTKKHRASCYTSDVPTAGNCEITFEEGKGVRDTGVSAKVTVRPATSELIPWILWR